ncbi:uncharacterized protein LAESUDRAFT_512994 [Laetiporus sulphureus 93-53]|uniref:Uncharacterized protein n=1 Tax=Laetiporus sulphureus 93-53 TaxID=1314785 RepID=A0A165FZ80_9APHY|nr:uncharacterized protein LAESUDRAFT_512994 [Laetiporus sulphureus 93-53]KZT09608.1 hypothetical protein LAESUDRAFT_512994 [Laetiporus sulphureus 93-53]
MPTWLGRAFTLLSLRCLSYARTSSRTARFLAPLFVLLIASVVPTRITVAFGTRVWGDMDDHEHLIRCRLWIPQQVYCKTHVSPLYLLFLPEFAYTPAEVQHQQVIRIVARMAVQH